MPIDLNLTAVPGSQTATPVAASESDAACAPLSAWTYQICNLLPSDVKPNPCLHQLVEENAALGKALQAIVDSFEKKVVVETPTVVAGGADVSAPASRGGSGTALPVVEKPTVVEVPVAAEKSAVAAKAPIVAEKPVVVEKPIVAEKPVVVENPVVDKKPIDVSETVANQVLPTEMPVTEAVPTAMPVTEAVPTAVPVTAAEVSVTAAPAVATPSAAMVEAAGAVADAILVSPGLMRGQGEITILLKNDVLSGTEVHVAVTGRQLEVTFVPTTHEVAVLIAQSQPVLTAHLSERIRTFDVSVDVRRRAVEEEERA